MQYEGNVFGSTFSISELPLILPSDEGRSAAHQDKVLILNQEIDTSLLLKTQFEIWGYQTGMTDRPEKSPALINNKKSVQSKFINLSLEVGADGFLVKPSDFVFLKIP